MWSARILRRVLPGLLATGMAFAMLPVHAAVTGEKSETVYVTADVMGRPESVLVSVCVTNPEEADTLRDVTALTDIENVGGSEAPALQPDGSWLFQAEGEDVYYQGAADPDSLPLAMTVTYTLDGKPVTGQALAGKSGRVGITVHFSNRHRETVSVKGENLSLYTPFTVITMITLDEKFSNITAENAKVMAEAGVNTVTGVMFPGLAANIDAEAEDQLADSFTVTADVVDFELTSITAIAVTGIMDADDLNDTDDMQEMVDGVDEMSDAGDELYDGTDEIYDGAREFEDGLIEYLDGIRSLYEGSMEATDGATELQEGVAELADGAGELADGARELADGVGELYSSIAGAGSGGAAGGLDPNAVAAEVGRITSGLATAIGAAGQNSQVPEAVKQALAASDPPITIDDATLSAIVAATAGVVAGVIAQDTKNGIPAAVGEAYQSGAAAAGNAAQAAVSAQMSQLLSGIAQLKSGADQLADGAKEMADGVYELVDGVGEFRDGMIDIEEALRELDEAGEELREGIDDLADGLRELRDGVRELNEEGLKELASNTSDMQILLDRKDAMVELGQDYDTFAGKPEGMAGTVKFVFETESIFVEKPIPVPEEAPAGAEPEEEPGFFARIWNWIKNLFGGE